MTITIKQVYKNKTSGQLLTTIPRKIGIKEGDYVRISLEMAFGKEQKKQKTKNGKV